jgi:hypothetical protein
MSLTHYSNGRPIPPEPPRASTMQAIRRRLYGRPVAEQDRIIKGFSTQAAAQAFLDGLHKPDPDVAHRIEPKLSDAELLRRQQNLDAMWEQKLQADAERAEREAQERLCHIGRADPDWPDHRSEKSWIWGDKAR